MFGPSILPYPQSPAAPRNRTCAESAQHTPRQNHLLAALPAADY